MNEEEKEHLRKILSEQEHLGIALEKQNWYTPQEAIEDIIDAVGQWQKECVYGPKCQVCGTHENLMETNKGIICEKCADEEAQERLSINQK